MSFLVTGFGRSRLAAGRPEQYLKIWQKKAENRRSNPILYIRPAYRVPRPAMPFCHISPVLRRFQHHQVAFLLVGDRCESVLADFSVLLFALSRSPKESPMAEPSVSAESSA